MDGDLISRSALLKKAIGVVVYDEGGWDCNVRAVPDDVVKNAPAVDAVEVVRCRDCIFCKPSVSHGMYFCDWQEEYVQTLQNDFCSHGKRRPDHA